MNIARSVGVTFFLSFRPVVPLVALSLPALVACEDESDPKTWVKRLDDGAQRGGAVRRLSQFFEDAMTRANKDREAKEVKELLDVIIEPMTKAYTAGGLDEKTRKDLIKFLSDTRDLRTMPALAKALNDFEMEKTDDDVREACTSIASIAKAGKLQDQAVIDAVWNVFAKFRLSLAKSERLVKAVHDAVLAVKHASYGPKAVEKLAAPVEAEASVDVRKDQLMFWQLTAIQVISELKFAGAVKPLVVVLLSPTKLDLNATARTALLKMAKEAEPVLVSALTGSDPDLKKLMDADKEKGNHAIVADTLGLLSRAAGRDAVVTALNASDNDNVRTGLAQSLVQFHPSTPQSQSAFVTAYGKIAAAAQAPFSMLKSRAALAQAASLFYDPNLTDWLVKETATYGDPGSKMLALESAFKLMTGAQKKNVADAMAKAEPDIKKLDPKAIETTHQMFKYASETLDKCKEDANCYLKVVGEPIASNPPTANWPAVKSSWMMVVYGGTDTAKIRTEAVKQLDKQKNPAARLALVQAIDKLAPQGDVAAAAELEKIVEADKAGGDANLLAADDAVVKVALRLRARAN